MSPRAGALGALAIALALAGCAVAPTPPDLAPEARAAAWRGHEARLATIDDWALNGRVAAEDGHDSWSAGIRWAQRGDEFRLRLSGPLGQGIAELTGGATGATLREADGTLQSAGDAESLLRERLGWTLPVGGLRYWVLGRPRPEGAVEGLELDGRGRARRFEQGGWTVLIDAYDERGDLALPAKLEVRAGPIAARLYVRDWRIGAATR